MIVPAQLSNKEAFIARVARRIAILFFCTFVRYKRTHTHNASVRRDKSRKRIRYIYIYKFLRSCYCCRAVELDAQLREALSVWMCGVYVL